MTRRQTKDGGAASTDSDQAVAGSKETSKKKRRKGRTSQKDGERKTRGVGQDNSGLEASQASAGQAEQNRPKRPGKATRSNKTSSVPGERCSEHGKAENWWMASTRAGFLLRFIAGGGRPD